MCLGCPIELYDVLKDIRNFLPKQTKCSVNNRASDFLRKVGSEAVVKKEIVIAIIKGINKPRQTAHASMKLPMVDGFYTWFGIGKYLVLSWKGGQSICSKSQRKILMTILKKSFF